MSRFESTDIEIVLNFHENKENPRRSVTKIKNHPGFVVGNFSYDNDISLLKLREPVIFEQDGQLFPICLPPKPPASYEDHGSKSNFTTLCIDCDFVQNPEERSMVMSRFTGYEIGNNLHLIRF